MDTEREVELCECEELHSDAISAAREIMPTDETLYDLADFFKILRVKRILDLFFVDLCLFHIFFTAL